MSFIKIQMNYRYLKLNLISILATEISGTILMLLFEMDASRTPNKSIMKYRLKMTGSLPFSVSKANLRAIRL